ncbi:hypothetical protein H0Z60_18370, partial [Ectothiorhodospiraceae bacterium WFHF3C12]|nr:hypothetical protein [Ectothiorhodospiraceae bacterium WFHF3C12]
MARKLAFVLALIGLCLATAVYALGLGNIQSDSALNEPLAARVPLLGVDEDEASSVRVDLASPEAFERAGIDRPFSLSRLNFEVKQGAQGTYIEITTKEPVKEPFLDFLLEVRWPQGRLVREYTLLLDPPTYAPGDGAPATQAPAVAAEPAQQPEPAETAAPEQTGTTGDATATGARSLGEVSEVAEPTVRQYTVEANDTLWEVAQTVQPDGAASINQTMLALFRENPDAFINSDMNRLKRGAVLRVPEQGAIESIPVAEANAEVQRQIERWQRNRGVAGGTGATGDGAGQQAAAASPESGASDGELRVVAPEEGTGEQPATSAQGEGGENLGRQVTLLRESNASLEAENEDLKAQVEALKREVSQLESRVNVEAGQALPS